jgi:hypothetical protein
MLRLRSHALTLALSCALTLSAATAVAQQESPAQWLARIFDPSTLGIKPCPNAMLNRKLSVDAIHLEHGGSKRIAIYTIPPDGLERASECFRKQLGVAPQVTGENSPWVTYTYDFTSGDKKPDKFKGLKVTISRSPFVDNKGQITMEYSPPAK